MTATSFSYYLSEDHFNHDEQMFILRIYHQDVSEVSFSIDYLPNSTFENKDDCRYQVSVYAIKCIKSKQNLSHQVIKLGFKSYSRL